MAVRALSLSGGAAHGSFQLGALIAIYEVYEFRPDVISATSVRAVNGILLATARPPAVNDPAAILASVASGNPDSGLNARGRSRRSGQPSRRSPTS
jgi:predicted acylesterase/phospholipase RssA